MNQYDVYGTPREKSIGVTITNENEDYILQASCSSQVALLPYKHSTTFKTYDPNQITLKLVELMEVKKNG